MRVEDENWSCWSEPDDRVVCEESRYLLETLRAGPCLFEGTVDVSKRTPKVKVDDRKRKLQRDARIDTDVVACSPSSVSRLLKVAGVLGKNNLAPSKKGTGFVQPLLPHEHWQIDVSYINLQGTFYYLCSVLDGCSRAIVHWDLCVSMTEAEIEIILQKARELVPRGDTANHLRQRAVVHRSRLQGVHPDRRNDACPKVPLLPPIQWETQTLAWNTQERSDPAQDAPRSRRRTKNRHGQCHSLQLFAAEQRHWIYHARRSAGRTRQANSSRTRSEARSRSTKRCTKQ